MKYYQACIMSGLNTSQGKRRKQGIDSSCRLLFFCVSVIYSSQRQKSETA